MRTVAVEQDTEAPLPVAAARAGDPAAWETLFRRYQLPLYAYAMDLVRHEPTSLDLIQETFLRATRHLPGLRDDGRFGSWLFGILHQLIVAHWRRTGRSPFGDEPVPADEPAPEALPDFDLIRREDATVLLAAVDALPEAQRSVVLLHYLESFSLADIAEISGASVGTVKSRLHYAKKTLRERLAPVLR